MVNVLVQFSTNISNNNGLKIEEGAIEDFTRNAYADGRYRAVVSFECMPHAFNPDLMQIIIDLTAIGEFIVVWGTICKEIIKFGRKAHGYFKNIILEHNNKYLDSIEINDEMTADELEEEIKHILEKLDNDES